MTELSYARGDASMSLLDEPIGACLHRMAGAHPDRDAVVSSAQGSRLTYAGLEARVDALATGLLDLGVVAGDRVGIWAPNCVEWMLVQYATAKIGAILVTINPAYRTSEFAYVVGQSSLRVLFCAESFKTSDYRAMVRACRDETPDLRDVFFFGDERWAAIADTAADFDRVRERLESLDCDDAINIQYTSGTTGFPKGATLTHRNILNNGYFVGELCSYTSADRICVPVPFYHCFGMVMGNLAALTHGSCVVIPAPGFDAVATLQATAAERCTSLYGVPTMFIAVLNDPSFASHDLGSLRTGIMAGAPCPSDTMRRVVEDMNMGEVSICYGMTETSPVSTQTRKDDPLERRINSIGRVGPHLEIKLIDSSTGATVARGQTGEVCTRGYSVMLGYWNDEAMTAEAKDADGWMHTGDLATMDDDGFLSIVGRSKDMVIRGGENVYPREVEEFLHGHPDIRDVQVVGVPDETFGEELCACVQLEDGVAALSVDDVRAFCAGRLAHYKVPRYVMVVEDFPLTVTGKVRKNVLRQEMADALGLADVGGQLPLGTTA